MQNIVPIFDQFPLMGKKELVYQMFKYLLLSDCVYYDQIQYIKESTAFKLALKSNQEKVSLINQNIMCGLFPSYFDAWLVGFIEAEGSFSIYSIKTANQGSSYLVAYFDIGQTDDSY